MAIFSRRKGSKTKVDDDGTTSHHSIKKPRLEQVRNTSSASTSDITLARAPGSQRSDSLKPLRPALSRTTRSDSSMYLTMHAVNNRLKMSSSSIDAEFSSLNPWIDADKKPGSRSPSPKKVSFNIDDEPIKPDRKRPASNSPLSTPRKMHAVSVRQSAYNRIALTAVDSEVTRDDASSIYSASSSEYSDTSGKFFCRCCDTADNIQNALSCR